MKTFHKKARIYIKRNYQWLLGTILIPIILFYISTFFNSDKNDPIPHKSISIEGNNNVIIQDNSDTNISLPYSKSIEYQTLKNQINDYEQLYKNIPQSDIESLKKYRNKIIELKEQEQLFINEVIVLAEYFKKVDNKSDKLSEAHKYFLNGEFHKADSILNRQLILSDQERLLKEKEYLDRKINDINNQLKTNSEELIAKAYLVSHRQNRSDRYKAALNLFNEALKSYKSFDNILLFADFQKDNKKFVSALKLYEEALDSLKNKPDLQTTHVAPILGTVGAIYLELGNFNKAQYYMQRELDIYRASSVSSYDDNYISCIHNLGLMSKSINDFKKARDLYNEALALRQHLNFNDVKNKIELAKIYNSLANINDLENNFSESIRLYESSLDLIEDLVYEQQNIEVISMAAGICSNLAQSYKSKFSYKKAENYYLKSIHFSEILITNNFLNYESLYASSLSNIGIFYLDNMEISKSEIFLLKGIELRKKLYQIDSSYNIESYARELANLGSLYYMKSELNLSLKTYKESLELYKILQNKAPKLYTYNICMLHTAFANIFSLKHEYSESDFYYKKGIEELEILAKKNPKIYDIDLSRVLINYSFLFIRMNNYEKAKEILLKSHSINMKYKGIEGFEALDYEIELILEEIKK